MTVPKYAYGIKSVKFGIPTGSNSMPGTLDQWAQTVQGSLTLSEDEATIKDFNVEETSTPVKSIVTNSGALQIKWRAYDMSVKMLEKVKGGVGTEGVSPSPHTYDGPTQVIAKDLALEVTTTEDIVFKIYKAAVVARFDGSISRENLLEIEVTAKAQDPGNGSSPYQVSLPNPT